MFQSPLRHAALLRNPSALPARLARTRAVVEPASIAARCCHGCAPGGRAPVAVGGPVVISAPSCSAIGSRPGPGEPARPNCPAAAPLTFVLAIACYAA